MKKFAEAHNDIVADLDKDIFEEAPNPLNS